MVQFSSVIKQGKKELPNHASRTITGISMQRIWRLDPRFELALNESVCPFRRLFLAPTRGVTQAVRRLRQIWVYFYLGETKRMFYNLITVERK